MSSQRLNIVLTLTATWKGVKPSAAEKGNTKLMAVHNRAGAVALDVGGGLASISCTVLYSTAVHSRTGTVAIPMDPRRLFYL
jgi:hypothetical protein